jgi:hypothetical protein
MSQAKGVRIMARDVTITERPIPPKGRLSFPLLMLRMIGNPVASWSEDFYVYRWLGLENVFVMDPELIQTILLDGAGKRRTAAPLFRSEELIAHVPAFASACERVLALWGDAAPGSLQLIGRDMTNAAMQALQDAILGADLENVGVSRIDRERIHLAVDHIVVGEKGAERPDGIPSSALASGPSPKEQTPKRTQMEALMESFMAHPPVALGVRRKRTRFCL